MQLTIGRKLQIPSLIMVVLLATVFGAFVVIRDLIEQTSAEVAELEEMETEIREAATTARDFAAGHVDFKAVGSSFQQLAQNIDAELFSAFLSRHPALQTPEITWAQIEALDALHDEQERMQQEIEELADNSISASRAFLQNVSERLADPARAPDVTHLERLVIAGADANTSLNYEIQVRFEKYRRTGDGKDALIGLLDDSIANTTVDIDRLSGTPFAQLPVQALESNQRIKAVVSAYVDDLQRKAEIETDIFAGMADVVSTVASEVSEATRASYATISTIFLVFALIVGAVSAGVIVINALLGRNLSSSIAGTIAVVAHVAEGDTDLGNFRDFMERHSRDEIDDLREKLRHMTSALRERSNLATAIAGGDLTRSVSVTSERDELGVAIRDMSFGLNELVREVQSAGDQINEGSRQVAGASQSLSQGATEQAASIEEIASSMTEIGSQTRQNADNAGTANEYMAEAKEIVGRTSAGMATMSEAMGDIDSSSQEISRINKVIDDIAFQTNLLALNAAVEAARAGQHGKGFAVVAEEVRNLAGRSARAASEASGLVEGTLGKVRKGSEQIAELEESFNGVVTSAGKVAEIVGDIAEASRQQAEGIGQINEALDQIDQITQNNTAAAEESAAAAEELSSQADVMDAMLSRFMLADSETSTAGTHAVAETADDEEVLISM